MARPGSRRLSIDGATARARWEPIVHARNADLARATGPGLHDDDDDLPEVLTGPPTVLARELDRWTARHREPTDPPTSGPHQVSGALHGMDPLRELMHLSAALQHLHHAPTPPAPDEPAHLRARVAALEATLGASPPAP